MLDTGAAADSGGCEPMAVTEGAGGDAAEAEGSSTQKSASKPRVMAQASSAGSDGSDGRHIALLHLQLRTQLEGHRLTAP
jgi:hypothetical protein